MADDFKIEPSSVQPNYVPDGIQVTNPTGEFGIESVPATNEVPVTPNTWDDNATQGATVGVDMKDSQSVKLSEDDLLNVRQLVAGEDITIRDAVGLWGEITETTTSHTATEASYVDSADADTNFDGVDVQVLRRTDTGQENHALIKFNLSSVLPTGATILKVRMFFYVNSASATATGVEVNINTATWSEGTVTWNTKSANGAFGNIDGSSTGYKNTGWSSITPTQYNNLVSYGVTLLDSDLNSADPVIIGDEDDANPPYVQIEYKIQTGEIFKVKATTSNYADSFIGIALNTSTKGGIVNVRAEGRVKGFSGLTAYSVYYLSDTDGAIATSAGTKSKIIGRALSTTELQVKYAITVTP